MTKLVAKSINNLKDRKERGMKISPTKNLKRTMIYLMMHVQKASRPKGFKIPDLGKYDGSKDPKGACQELLSNHADVESRLLGIVLSFQDHFDQVRQVVPSTP